MRTILKCKATVSDTAKIIIYGSSKNTVSSLMPSGNNVVKT